MYLRVSTPKYVDHDLHDGFVHAQRSHKIGMLVEHFVTHYIPEERTEIGKRILFIKEYLSVSQCVTAIISGSYLY